MTNAVTSPIVELCMSRRAELGRAVASHLEVLDCVGEQIMDTVGSNKEIGRFLVDGGSPEPLGRKIADAYVAGERRLWGGSFRPEYRLAAAGEHA